MSKTLKLTFKFIKILSKNKCTLQEADEILKLVQSQLDYQRERSEYASIDDYLMRKKSKCADNDIVVKL